VRRNRKLAGHHDWFDVVPGTPVEYGADQGLVLEVAFDQIQKSARHASGFALRFPRIKRIRWDKSIHDADRLARVAEIYEMHANTARALHPPEIEPAPPPEPTLFDGIA